MLGFKLSYGYFFASILASTFGYYYFRFGKKISNSTIQTLGIALFAMPYIVRETYYLLAASIILIIIGYKIR